MDFSWFSHESDDIMESLIAISSSKEDMNVGEDILNYLLQEEQEKKENEVKSIMDINSKNPDFQVIQKKGNFVTFMPSSVSKRSFPLKKPKFREPVFVTESPQSFSKKNKKNNQQLNSSCEDISDEELDNLGPSAKSMSLKERRQLKNKISARNFRVRRKEYIIQLEEKVEKYEKTIQELRKENQKLIDLNQVLKDQVGLNTSPFVSLSGSESITCSSSSEGNHSPEVQNSSSQFQLNDLYDFSLFDQLQQPLQQNIQVDSNSIFYINETIVPEINLGDLLNEKENLKSNKEKDDDKTSKDLMENYPLLVPALMSIILRHTISLDYVASIAKELQLDLTQHNKFYNTKSEDYKESFKGHPIEGLKTMLKSLTIDSLDNVSDLEFLEALLLNHFPYYTCQRAIGKSHRDIVDNCRKAFNNPKSQCYNQLRSEILKNRLEETNGPQKNCKKSSSCPTQTLNTFCSVAGELLKHPERMSFVRSILKSKLKAKERIATRIEHFKKKHPTLHNTRVPNIVG